MATSPHPNRPRPDPQTPDEAPEPSNRPSGLDKEYGGAGYAGPGGFGGGYGGEAAGQERGGAGKGARPSPRKANKKRG